MKPRLLVFSALAAPFVVLLVLVCVMAVNVPFMDQWEFVKLFEKHSAGTLGFADFFAQHNEHRLLFPRLLMYGLAMLSHWNVVWEMIASVLLAGAGFVLLYQILKQTFAEALRLRVVVAGMLGSIFFSPIQWENWLWGWQVQWYLNLFGLIVAIWALSTWQARPWQKVLVAALGAGLATYSLGSGFFVWAVALPFFWLVKPLRQWLWVWLLLTGAAAGSYYIGYHDLTNTPVRLLILHEPFTVVRYVGVYLAHPLTPFFGISVFVAPLYVVGLAATLWYIFRRYRAALAGPLLPWLTLGLYACCAAVSTAVARLDWGLGVIQAYSSRYTALSQLLLCLLVVLLGYIWMRSKATARLWRWQLRTWLIGVAVVMIALVGANYMKGVWQMYQYHNYIAGAQHCAQTATSKDDPCLPQLYPSPGHLYPRLEYLRQHHLGGL